MSNHEDHPHSKDAFCGNAGPEEYKHLQSLLDELTDKEIQQLVDAVEINFGSPTSEIDRSTLEGVLDEAAREDFYREYHKILEARK
jgi:hypothetical protein